MNRERIEIFADKRFAFIFFAALLCLSVWLIIYYGFGDSSVIGIVFATIVGLLIGLLSTFGLFTLFSNKFVYYGPKTKEYETQEPKPFFIVQKDRLQCRVNFRKQIYYKDISSVSLVPVYDSQDESVFHFLEIKTSKSRLVLTENVSEFIKSFEKFSGQKLEMPRLDLEAANKRFGSTKFFFASMLGIYNQLRIKLWEKKIKTTYRQQGAKE